MNSQEKIAAAERFNCSPSLLWRVLTDYASYKSWFGFPETEELLPLDTAFCVGAKMNFKNSTSTRVITSLVTERELSISSSCECVALSIKPVDDSSCDVFLSVTGVSAKKAAPSICALVLSRLRDTAAAYKSTYAAKKSPAPPAKRRRIRDEIVSAMMLGYKTPLNADSTVAFEQTIENTETDVVLPRIASVVAAIMAFFLLTVISSTFLFERSDVVPSSGLSVTQSDGVNIINAERIYIGQPMIELEMMLGCRGIHVEANRYRYSSTNEAGDGTPLELIEVVYDSNGTVRRAGYTDIALSHVKNEITLRDINNFISPSMTIPEIIEIVGRAPSAFWIDKSAVTTILFGAYDVSGELFSQNARSELVVRLNSANISTSADFYLAYDLDNPLHVSELSDNQKLQYSTISQYKEDLAMYERVFLILGKERSSVDAALPTRNIEYLPDFYGVRCSYGFQSSITAADNPRFVFDVLYHDDDIAQRVTFKNNVLCKNAGTLKKPESYKLREGMTLFEVYSELGVLPTYAQYSPDRLVLCFGAEIGNFKAETRNYQLAITFGSDEKVISYSYYD
ncbi:MAG: hypothetical protein RSG78_05250 [Oscillospiraceae bacterium]